MQRPPAPFLFLLFLLSSCAAHLPPPSVPIRNASDLVRVVSARTRNLRDMEARAKIDMRIDGVRQQAAAFVLYRRPDRLKLDVSGPLGVGLLSALSRNDTLSLYLPRQNRYVDGPPEEVLYRVTGVNLTYYTVDRAVLGLPGLSPADLPRIGRFEPRGDSLFVDVYDPLWTRRLRFDRRTAVLCEEAVYTPQGDLLSRRTMAAYRSEDGVVLPRRIEIAQGRNRLEIRITRRQINEGVPEDRFRLRIPSDALPLNHSP